MQAFFHIDSLSPLYEAVQSAAIFADSKYFVDCRPKQSAAAILEAYHTASQSPDFDLKSFVESYFEPPFMPESTYETGSKSLSAHLTALWDELTRHPQADTEGGTLLTLPNAYIVPGGRFREIYYWDSYFTMLGLKQSGRVDLIKAMVDNFAYLIDTVGFIPNGNRSYYLGRSQPPFFALMVSVLAEVVGEAVWQTYAPHIRKEYDFWMAGAAHLQPGQAHRRVVRLPDGTFLNRYWDDVAAPRPEAYIEDQHIAAQTTDAAATYRHIRAAAESGWDFSSRWFTDPHDMATIHTTDLLPVDLNCLLWYMEASLAKIEGLNGQTAAEDAWYDKALQRADAVLKYCWNAEKGFFADYNHQKSRPTEGVHLAMVFPLFFNLATQSQAEAVASTIENHCLKPGGLVTTPIASGQQWDAPNGWAPLQWMAYKAMKNYGFDALAADIRHNWVVNVEKVFAETGKMMEKYNVEDTAQKAGGGEYPNQDGFGWTNGVYLALKNEAEAV